MNHTSDVDSAAEGTTPTIENRLPGDWAQGAMREDIAAGFAARPFTIPPKWLYDDAGSALFDRITRLDEYYPTEAERSILAANADDIVRRSGARTVVELGSGTSDKTRTVLDAFWSAGRLERFVPFDVSQQTLVDAAEMLAARYPGLSVHAIVGDFNRHLHDFPGDERLVLFLGGTLGNFTPAERAAFLGALSAELRSGETVLLGVDLMKDVDRILDAYDDADGVSEAFIVNVLHVVNRELDGDLSIDDFEYAPMWDHRHGRLDMRLRALRPISATLAAIEVPVELAAGEEIRVEFSTKFRPARIEQELDANDFDVDTWWTDPADDFGVVLARRR